MSATLGRMDVLEDGVTARLLALTRATQACEALPKESARTLVAYARGVRLYLEARQRHLALGAIDDIELLMSSVDDEHLVKAYADLIGAVRKALHWKPPGRGHTAA